MKKLTLISLFFILLAGAVLTAKREQTFVGSNVVSTGYVKLENGEMSESGVRGLASWYGESKEECMGCSSHRITKCGVKYDETTYTLASNDFECGTEVWVVYGEKRVLAQINDTGGFNRYGRIADLSKATFAFLADLDAGIIKVNIFQK